MERGCEGEEGPTILPHPGFDALKDAVTISKAVESSRGDKKKILVDVLCHRTCRQRLDIADTFRQRYRTPLLDVIKAETDGDFQNVLGSLIQTPSSNDARSLHNALKGHVVDLDCVIEILCTRTAGEISETGAAYQTTYRHSMEEDVRKRLPKSLADVLLSFAVLKTVGPSDNYVEDAGLLIQSSKTSHAFPKALKDLLTTRSRPYLLGVFEEFAIRPEANLEASVRSQASGDEQQLLLALVQIVRDIPAYFAHRLHHAMKGWGTKDSSLIRIVVSRSEKDLRCIKERYHDAYETFLEESIERDTSHHYQRALLALVLGN